MSIDRAEQIMPAGPGWGAAFARFDFDGGAEAWSEPLCGWAITRDSDGAATVAGLVVHPEFPTSVIACYEARAETRDSEVVVHFLGYLRPGQDVEGYHEEAEEAYGRWRQAEAEDRELSEAGWSMGDERSYGSRWEAPDGRRMGKRDALRELRGGGGAA